MIIRNLSRVKCKQLLQKMKNLKNIIINSILFSFVFVSFVSTLAEAAPNRINFQAKIKKPDGSNLEAPDVLTWPA